MDLNPFIQGMTARLPKRALFIHREEARTERSK